jgi:hypothetical protein
MSSKSQASDDRKQRLAKALKGNIAKRKEAAKAREAAPEPPETSPHDNDDEGCPN